MSQNLSPADQAVTDYREMTGRGLDPVAVTMGLIYAAARRLDDAGLAAVVRALLAAEAQQQDA